MNIFKNAKNITTGILALSVFLQTFSFGIAPAMAAPVPAPGVGSVRVLMNILNNPYVDGNGFTLRASVSGGGWPTSTWIDTNSCEYTIDGSNWYAAQYLLGNCYKDGLSAVNNSNLSLNIRVKNRGGTQGTGVAINKIADNFAPISKAVIDNEYYGPNTYLTTTIKGSATDSNGISSVKITIQRSSDNRYWSGSSWNIMPTSLDVSGSENWSYAQLPALALSNDVSYIVTPILTTDYAGRIQFIGQSDSFTWDNTTPAVPTNGIPHNKYLNTNIFDFSWNTVVDNSPVSYEFQCSQDPTQINGVLTNNLWKSDTLSVNSIHSSGAPNGAWYWQVQSSDSAKNTSDWSTIWKVTLDTEKPAIGLVGDRDVTLEYGDIYEELGAIWKDNIDDDGDATVGGDIVDTKTLGTYVVTYDAADSAGNKAEQVTRTVKVVKRKITITADNKSKAAGSTDPSLTYSVIGSLVGSDALTGSLARANGESAGLYGIGIGSLNINDNYDLVFVDGILEITPAPVSLTQASTNNPNPVFTDFEDTEVLGIQTDKKDTDKEDVKGVTDEKKDRTNGFFESKVFGIYTWLWLVFLASLAGAGWWAIAGRKKRE